MREAHDGISFGAKPNLLHTDSNYAGGIINWGGGTLSYKKKKNVKQGSLRHDVNEFLTSDVTDWLR